MVKHILDIKVLGLEKIRKDIAGKRYEFILKVKWSNNIEAIIYRTHSMFFDFQGVLAAMFKDEKIPSAPVVKFHWALLGKLGQERDCKRMEDFCMKIIRLPPAILTSSIVLHFFETWGTDLRTNQKSSELFDPVVGRASIQSTQETVKTNLTLSDDQEDQFMILMDYEATNIGEISLVEGKTVTIIEKNERGWWFIADDTGRQGWAPATYLEPISSSADVGYDWVSVTDANGKGEQYISMVLYNGQNADELSYSANEEVEVLQKSNYGWWNVRVNGKVGITPATNLQRANDISLYSSADELRTRRLSISSASGLYAVIRKPPPRKESVRSRSSSGISQLQSPNNSFKNGLTGKKPSRFVYSTASFAGGKFIIGEDDKENEPATELSEEGASKDEEDIDTMNQGETYQNVDSEFKVSKLVRSPLAGDTLSSMNIFDYSESNVDQPSYENRQFNKPADSREVEFYSALAEYIPNNQKKEDLCLSKGDIVQLISTDSGWMYVMRMTGDMERQGWVPETYLERRYDVYTHEIADKEDIKPKPRPRPLPRPKNKPESNNNILHPKRLAPPPPTRRTSAPEIDTSSRPNLTRPSLPDINDSIRTGLPQMTKSELAQNMATRPAMPAPLLDDTDQIRKQEGNLYDEPETQLRSVYDAEQWYLGGISRPECERILGTYGRQKEFVIRESQRAVGSYALSVKYCYRIRHFGIEPTKSNGLMIGMKTFPNLMEIVSYYQQNALFYSEHKDHITLGEPFDKNRVPK